MKWLKSFDNSLFGQTSPVTMGVLRMITGFLALLNFLFQAGQFTDWYTEKGYYPVWQAQKWAGGDVNLNLLWNVTDARVTLALYVVLCVSAFTTMLGLWTRVSSILLFVLTVTFHHRCPDILNSGDTLLRQMCFFVMIAPSGAACSLDRLTALWKGKAPLVPPLVSIWPQRLWQYQVTIVYFTTVWHKWTGSHWRDGTATWFVPQLREFERFPVPAFFDHQPMVAVTTYVTLVIELGIAFLAYSKPLRKYVLIGGLILHAGIEYRFNIPLFAFVMTSTYLSFYYGDEVTVWAKRLGQNLRRLRVKVLTPQGTSLDPAKGQALVSMDAFGLVDFEPGDSTGWKAVGPGGHERDPYSSVLKTAPAAWPLALVPQAWKRLMDGSLTKAAKTEAPHVQS
ncbi:MAG: HTTM domain-containing protein [Armatimonadetes bacterium]|nr:HTTM domain-containing protein [Armatimonadota bacterium]